MAAAPAAAAQDSTDALAPGRRIRVHQKGHDAVTGSLISATPEAVSFTTPAFDTVTVPRDELKRLDVSMGTISKVGPNALTGFLGGAAVGGLLGLALGVAQNQDDFFYVSPAASAAGGAVLFGAIGAVVGALSGTGKRGDKWQRVSLPAVEVGPGGPEGKGVAIGLRFKF